MDGATGILIELGARFVVFGLVFVLVAYRHPKVTFHNKWATPLIALVFAALNTGLYWVLTPILALATLGALGFVMPLIANAIFLAVTVRIFRSRRWFEIDGLVTHAWMVVFLTLAHGALWLGFEYLPKHL